MTKSQLKEVIDYKEVDAIYVDNELFVSRKFLENWYDVGRTAVINWFSTKGAEHSSFDDKWCNFKEFQYWHSKNINKSFSNKSKNSKDFEDDDVFDGEFLESLTDEERRALTNSAKDPLDRLKDIKEIQKRDIANKEALGQLVPAERLDFGMSELAMIQIGQYRNDKRILPKKLEVKKAKEIDVILDNLYEKRIKDLSKIAKIKSKSKAVIDIFEVVQEKLLDFEADKLIEKINEL